MEFPAEPWNLPFIAGILLIWAVDKRTELTWTGHRTGAAQRRRHLLTCS